MTDWIGETDGMAKKLEIVSITWTFTEKFVDSWCGEWSGGTNNVKGKKLGSTALTQAGVELDSGGSHGEQWADLRKIKNQQGSLMGLGRQSDSVCMVVSLMQSGNKE